MQYVSWRLNVTQSYDAVIARNIVPSPNCDGGTIQFQRDGNHEMTIELHSKAAIGKSVGRRWAFSPEDGLPVQARQ
jgi:hypothetical protein